MNAASEQSLESDPGAYRPKSIWDSPKNALDAFYRFSRPHTVIGTVKFKVDGVNCNEPCLEFYSESHSFDFLFSFKFSFQFLARPHLTFL